MPYAYSKNTAGTRNELSDHLRSMAQLAEEFAKNLGNPKTAYYVGLWHDLGKFHPDFQDYLLKSEEDPEGRGHGPAHKAAGAWHCHRPGGRWRRGLSQVLLTRWRMGTAS